MAKKEIEMSSSTKRALTSKAIWGALVVILSQLMSIAGYDIGPVEAWTEGVYSLVMSLIANDVTGILGALWGMYGRWVARKPISGV